MNTHPELVKLFSDFDKPDVKLAPEVVRQTPVVVVESQVGGAHLTHSQFLLLEAGGRRGVSVNVLQRQNVQL